MDKTQLNSIVLNMYTCSYESGNIIFKEGDIGYSLFIIKSGEVNCESKNGEIKRILKSKDHFGEYAVLFDIPRSLTVKAKSKIVIYKISSTVLEDSLGSDYRNIILQSILREAFHMSKYFSVLASSYYINELYQNSKIILLQDDTKVNFEEIKKGETSEQHDDNANKILYCIICGNFVIKNNNHSNSIKVVANRGQLYGEEFLNLKSKILNTKNDIYTEGECRIFKI